MTIVEPREGQAVSEAEVRSFLETQINRGIEWLDESAALARPLVCIDGRFNDHDLQRGIPTMLGGTAGEVLRQVAAFVALLPDDEQRSATDTIHQNVEQLHYVIQTNGLPFAVHTDTHAQPGELGCGYLNLLATHPDKFGLGLTKLVHDLVNISLDKRELSDNHAILSGHHQERGVLVLQPEGKAIPIITPNTGTEQFFIYVPRLEQALRVELLSVLLPCLEELTRLTVDRTQFTNQLNSITADHVTKALDELAPGKPVFDVRLDQAHGVIDITER
ncbi:hypothetical protein HY524_00515 [Candidatus Berkelbacteria bacterium]|nr:hypothetical protein [Candidatus Berkelbacteria bacterium]